MHVLARYALRSSSASSPVDCWTYSFYYGYEYEDWQLNLTIVLRQ